MRVVIIEGQAFESMSQICTLLDARLRKEDNAAS